MANWYHLQNQDSQLNIAHLHEEVAFIIYLWFISIKIDYSMQRTMQETLEESSVGGDRAKIWVQMSSIEKLETQKFRRFHREIMAINT